MEAPQERCTIQPEDLLVQGENDYRCPAEQSEQFYSVLKAKGCIVEMVRFPASPHIGSIAGAPIFRRVQNEVLLDWMNRHVLGVVPEEKTAAAGETPWLRSVQKLTPLKT